jgi:hypothetical protein
VKLSVGHLHSAHRLLEIAFSHRSSPPDLLVGLRTVLVCSAESVINLSMKSGWLEVDADGNLKLTARGHVVHSAKDFRTRVREQLRDFIRATTPAWGSLIPRGRAEVCRFVPADVAQCFEEAGLLEEDVTPEIVEWWDDLANKARGLRAGALSDIGRSGERHSLAYEAYRTGRLPLWQSIESNLSGFDILSIVDKGDPTPLSIEVKASEVDGGGEAHVSTNEWATAVSTRNFVFHLWRLKPSPALAILSVDDIRSHIPSNTGEGRWESVAIPFASFNERFASRVID